jgi:hypothetical protein
MENTLARFVRFSAVFLNLATTGFVKNTDGIFLLFWWLRETQAGLEKPP